MIECPWCHKEIEIKNGKCPECRSRLYEVTEDDFSEVDEKKLEGISNDLSIEDLIMNHYKCPKCKKEDCRIKEAAMTGTGLSKIFDIQHNHYLFVSCENCGYVEIYDPDILRGKAKKLGTIMDILFGN